MGNRLYTAAVVVFWLAAMGWLLVSRILPPFFFGDAPPTSLAYQVRPVAWRLEMDEVPCGKAVLQAITTASGVRQVHSVLKLTRLPAPEKAPFWMRPFLASLSDLSIEMRTVMTFGSDGSLVGFKTNMRVNQLDAPIQLTGRIRNEKLDLRIHAAGATHRIQKDWPKDASLAGELTPASRLLPLWEGRQWTKEVYSPFASPKAPLQLLEAIVTGQIRLEHNGENIDVWTVEYRTTDKTGSTDEGRLRGRQYVDGMGWILKQEAFLLGSEVVLYRESDERSAKLAEEFLELSDREPTPGSASDEVTEMNASASDNKVTAKQESAAL